ncbi:MAG TPA: ABC transporter ATP-binding protein, partial [Thermodesulfobacteriota bacterium]|nr:ABC transporter ATP-binding protein [Thermodesulfobacteriota bacterium]
ILQGVSFEVHPGKVTVFLGRNGAGKSTTLRTIMGLLSPSQGTVLFKNRALQHLKPYEISRLGIGFVPEDRGIFNLLTVEENFRVAMLQEDGKSREMMETIFEIFPDLKKFWKAKAGILSGGQKQMLAIARPLVNRNELLLIDEPSKGLAPIVIDHLIDSINKLKEYSVIILVEQNFYMASNLGDDFYLFDDGKTVHKGEMKELVQNEELKKRYLGISSTS